MSVGLGLNVGIALGAMGGAGGAPAPDFFLPLTSSLIPLIGAGSPTFTRNTAASVTDFEGVKSGEARFEGARRVENLLSYSENFSNVAWGKAGIAVTANATTAPDGTLTAGLAIENATTQEHSVYNLPKVTIKSGGTYSASIYLKAGTRRYVQLTVGVNSYTVGCVVDTQLWTIVSTGASGGSTYRSSSLVSAGNGWYKVSLTGTLNTTEGYLGVQGLDSATYAAPGSSSGSGTWYQWGAQLENVTGQSVQTAGEYVSTNVLTSAPYHGANVDGVKYFTTNLDGSAISDATLKGYLAEGQRTNYLLNSNTLVTQNVTVTAQAYTLSFSGTGTVTLSGAYSGSLVGTGVSNRVQLTFTPTAGTLVVTVSGTCTKGQLEAGIFASSYTGDTTGTTLTRNADALSYLSSLFSDTAGTAYVELTPLSWANVAGGILGDGSNNIIAPSYAYGAYAYDGVNTANGPSMSPTGKVKAAIRWGNGKMRVFANGIAGAESSYDGAFSLSSLLIGNNFYGNIKNVRSWYNRILSDYQCQKMTA